MANHNIMRSCFSKSVVHQKQHGVAHSCLTKQFTGSGLHNASFLFWCMSRESDVTAGASREGEVDSASGVSGASSAIPVLSIGEDVGDAVVVSPSEADDQGEQMVMVATRNTADRTRFTPGEVRDNYDERTEREQDFNDMEHKLRNM